MAQSVSRIVKDLHLHLKGCSAGVIGVMSLAPIATNFSPDRRDTGCLGAEGASLCRFLTPSNCRKLALVVEPTKHQTIVLLPERQGQDVM